MTDVTIRDEGSICLLIPQTEQATAWFDENIGVDNGYQPYWPTVVVEHRYVSDIVLGFTRDGLTLSES